MKMHITVHTCVIKIITNHEKQWGLVVIIYVGKYEVLIVIFKSICCGFFLNACTYIVTVDCWNKNYFKNEWVRYIF